MEKLLEGGGKFALAVIADRQRDFGDAHLGFQQQLGGLPHAVLLHVCGDRSAVNRFKQRLHGGRVHQVLLGKLLDGDALAQMVGQVIVNLTNQLDLLRLVLGGTLRRQGLGMEQIELQLQCFEPLIDRLGNRGLVIEKLEDGIGLHLSGKGNQGAAAAELFVQSAAGNSGSRE